MTPVAWKPRISVIGIGGGILGAIGIVLYLQQSGSVYPTQNVTTFALLGGLLAGVVLPSLGRAVAVARINRAIAGRAEPAPSYETEPVAEPVVVAAGEDGLGWRATHVVGDSGADGWEEPDPALPATALDPALEVEVLEERGDWAHVRCANGWRAWVDGRRLTALGS